MTRFKLNLNDEDARHGHEMAMRVTTWLELIGKWKKVKVEGRDFDQRNDYDILGVDRRDNERMLEIEARRPSCGWDGEEWPESMPGAGCQIFHCLVGRKREYLEDHIEIVVVRPDGFKMAIFKRGMIPEDAWYTCDRSNRRQKDGDKRIYAHVHPYDILEVRYFDLVLPGETKPKPKRAYRTVKEYHPTGRLVGAGFPPYPGWPKQPPKEILATNPQHWAYHHRKKQ